MVSRMVMAAKIEAEEPGDQVGAADQQRGAQAALDRDRGRARGRRVGRLAARRAQHVLDRQMAPRIAIGSSSRMTPT